MKEIIIKIIAEKFENGKMIKEPVIDMGIYDGDWHRGINLGFTDKDGVCVIKVEETAEEIGIAKMTSSHTMFSKIINISEIVERIELIIAVNYVIFRGEGEIKFGEALYIAGCGETLGEWKKVTRLDYNIERGIWELEGYFPVGGEFKFLRGEWKNEKNCAITNDFQWENGENRKITSPEGSYQSIIYGKVIF